MIVEASITSAFNSIAASTSFSQGTDVPRYSTSIPNFSIPPCFISITSFNPTECSSSPTVAATILNGCSSTKALISSSLKTSGFCGIIKSSVFIKKSTLPFNWTLVPSEGCITSECITSGSLKFIFLANSIAANSAVLWSRGKNISTWTTPSANHSTSGFTKFVFLNLSVSSILLLTLSSSSSSSIKTIFSGFSRVHPSIRVEGQSVSFKPYWAMLLFPKWAVTGAI